MNELKNIVLGVSGSIAAHKAIDLASLLAKSDCSVNVMLTADAEEFVRPLPFETLTGRPVIRSLYNGGESPVLHVNIADEADLLLIAPVTANTIAKLACGIADDALSCTALALNPDTPILVAPAMNGKMWNHPATQSNVSILRDRGVEFIGPDEGMLSCGYEGVGRFWPIEGISDRALQILKC
ncbi:MAG: flavoprotein [Verrucomicrobiota bacterium]|nr:flavoprotein [Verrucomicrobiota bacterium]